MPSANVINILIEKLFHFSEKKRLASMKSHTKERDSHAHLDFLSLEPDVPHRHRIERHAAEFWNHYFEGESPQIGRSEHTEDSIAYGRMVNPPLTSMNVSLENYSEDRVVLRKKWLQLTVLAKVALQTGQYEDAEHDFRESLRIAEHFGENNPNAALSAVGLAESLLQLGKTAEADNYFAIALLINEALLGSGDANFEDEFYGIARYFLDEGKCEEMEHVYEDLIERLRMSVGRNDPLMARCLNELGVVYAQMGNWQPAETLYSRAIEIFEKSKPMQKTQLASAHNNYAALCQANDRHNEAESHAEQAGTLTMMVLSQARAS